MRPRWRATADSSRWCYCGHPPDVQTLNVCVPFVPLANLCPLACLCPSRETLRSSVIETGHRWPTVRTHEQTNRHQKASKWRALRIEKWQGQTPMTSLCGTRVIKLGRISVGVAKVDGKERLSSFSPGELGGYSYVQHSLKLHTTPGLRIVEIVDLLLYVYKISL